MSESFRADMFNVSKAAYRVFYRILKAKFFQQEHNSNPQRRGQNMWTFSDSSTGLSYGHRLLIGTSSNNPSYFYRKYSEFRPSNDEFGSIKIDVFVNGLEYIDIKPLLIDESEYKKIKYPENKIEYLYNSFLEQYKNEIQEEQTRVKGHHTNKNQKKDISDSDIKSNDKKIGSIGNMSASEIMASVKFPSSIMHKNPVDPRKLIYMPSSGNVRISTALYKVFFEKFENKFLDKYCSNKRIMKLDIWLEVDRMTSTLHVLKFFNATLIRDPFYFLHKSRELDPKKNTIGLINGAVFYSGLSFLMIDSWNDKITYTISDFNEKIEHLYYSFLERYEEEIQKIENNNE